VCLSAIRFEGEIIVMGFDLFNVGMIIDGDLVGMITSGGSVSILYVVLFYCEYVRVMWGVILFNFVKLEMGYVVFDKVCYLFGIELCVVPIV